MAHPADQTATESKPNFLPPVEGEGPIIEKMLAQSITFAGRIAHPADLDDVHDWLAETVVIAVRRWLNNEPHNEATLRSYVFECVKRRVMKVWERRQTRERLAPISALHTDMAESTEIEDVLDRLPPTLRAVAVYILDTGKTASEISSFNFAFELGIEPGDVRAAIEEIREILGG